MINVLGDMVKQKIKATLLCDNTAAVEVATGLHLPMRSHHVAREYHYVSEQIFDDMVEVVWIDTAHRCADIFTKLLGNILFDGFEHLIGMVGATW